MSYGPDTIDIVLRDGAIRRRSWSLWRLVLEFATNPLGLAARLGL